MGRLRTMTVPLPPLELQLEFSKFCEANDIALFRLRESLEKADALFASLQSRAFKGEL